MRFRLYPAILLPLVLTVSLRTNANPDGADVGGSWAKQELVMIENRGQLRSSDDRAVPEILFSTGSSGAQIFITGNSLQYQFSRRTDSFAKLPTGIGQSQKLPEGANPQFEIATLGMSLEGANPHPEVVRSKPDIYTENYYLAHCPQGITNVRSFHKVVMKDVYPGIDWILRADKEGLKYDFLVHPGADPRMIRLRIDGAKNSYINTKGELELKTSLGSVLEKEPVSFQRGRTIPTAFKAVESGTYAFALSVYDAHAELTIDPSIAWSSFFGGLQDDEARGCAADTRGNVYVSGSTNSLAGIAYNGFQGSYGGGVINDAFLAKFNSEGKRLWATYYGGSALDFGYACATSGDSVVYLAGTTSSSGLGWNGYQNSIGGGYDAFLVKFDWAGHRSWATYFGKGGDEEGFSCAVNDSGYVYIAGYGRWSNLGYNGFQNQSGGEEDAYLSKFKPDGSIVWATNYGGADDDQGLHCITADSNQVYLVGYAKSLTGIASGGHQNSYGGGTVDGMIVKFDGNGTRLLGSYYGGPGGDMLTGGTVDRFNNLFVSGFTSSTSGIAANGLINTYSGPGWAFTAFLVKFNAGGTRIWGTYYGGPESSPKCASDDAGNVYIFGGTRSLGLAVRGFKNSFGTGYSKAFIGKFTGAGGLRWGSYYGGNEAEQGMGICVSGGNVVYICGITQSTSGIAVGNVHQDTTGGGIMDAFVARIYDTTIVTKPISTTSFCAGAQLTIPFSVVDTIYAGNVYTAELSDSSGSFLNPVAIGSVTSTNKTDSITATIPANTISGSRYRVRIVASNPAYTGTDNRTDIQITAQVTPQVSVSVSPDSNIAPGQQLVFTALPLNEGLSPSFQWQLNGQSIPGADSAQHITNSSLLQGNDSITVFMRSNAACATPDSAISAVIRIHIIPGAGVNNAIQSGVKLQIAPNPTTSELLITGDRLTAVSTELIATIYSVKGASLQRKSIPVTGNHFTVNFPLDTQLPAGNYIVSMQLDGSVSTAVIAIQR